ncbi:hypothetical protein GGS23DRAFT_584232 [Durotheca rogersii]|uniref:uncharacterized protein n=1 Tax=Durotheca rogersii TaxID=419775 RepID=UPI00221F8075|nr:uncharacterized protein GGS23DRAFT_584232 [Durotheca rogersii]KAI5859740.1 hypothetical protein GGS23DRAFT_584232 [Durotheca rogersii]
MTTIATDENLFSKALKGWKDQLRPKDRRGKFYERVIEIQAASMNLSANEEVEVYAQELKDFLKRYEKENKLSRICSKIRPLVGSLKRLMMAGIHIGQSTTMGSGGAVFGGALLLLELSKDHEGTFSKMGDLMHDIDVRLFCNDKNQASFRTSKKMQEMLVEDYTTIINIWHRASIILGRSTWRNLGSSLVKSISEEWDEYLRKLEKNARDMRMIAEAIATKEARHRKIAKWIAGGQKHDKFDFRNRGYQDRTCTWILEDERFKRWCSDASITNQVVWYNAPPGSGKTFLSAMVARHMEEKNLQVVHFRFDYNDNERNSPLSALRSIALRLLKISATIRDDIPDGVYDLYEAEAKHYADQLTKPRTAIGIIKAFLNDIPRVHIIVDGLDECQQNADESLDLLSDLFCYAANGIVKWFFTSRSEPPIRRTMQNANVVEICPSKDQIERDITIYLEAKKSEMKIKMCEDCVALITAKSDANFLYSALIFRILCDDTGMSEEERHEQLSSFPDGLKHLYQRCIARIAQRDKIHRDFARRIFVFMACAAQPFTINQLLHALAVRLGPGHDEFQPSRISEFKRIRDLCGSLIEVEDAAEGQSDGDRVIKFVHKSVLEYLTQSPAELGIEDREFQSFFVDIKEGNRELGRHCLGYLNYRRYQGKVDISTMLSDREEHALLKYAAAFWFLHLGRGDPSPELFAEVKSFLQSPAFWTCLAAQAKAHPHLFSTYTKTGSGFAVGQRDVLIGDRQIADILPHWLPGCAPDGHRYTKALQEYIAEWNGMLKLSDEPWGHCVMDQESCELFAGLKSVECENVRLQKLMPMGFPSTTSLTDISFKGSDLCTRIAYPNGNGMGWSDISAKVIHRPEHHVFQNVHCKSDFGDRLIRFSRSIIQNTTESRSAWSINLYNMSIEYDGQEVYTGLPDRAIARDSTTWNMVTQSVSTIENDTAYGIHFTASSLCKSYREEIDSAHGDDTPSEESSEDGPSDPADDSGHHSDSDPDEHPGDSDTKAKYSCLVFLREGETPIVRSWTRGRGRPQVSCAFHPFQKVAVWSQSPGELQVLDMTTGEISVRQIDEPAESNSSASAVVRSLHFSGCGRYLDYLLITYEDDATKTSLCNVFLSTYKYGDKAATDPLPGTVRRLVYKVGEATDALPEPYLLSHWDTNYVYLCLPDFSLCPKIVRFSLRYDHLEASAADTSPYTIQTLTHALFFPTSTARRSPRILYRGSLCAGKPDRLVLALDSLRLSDSSGQRFEAPPLVITWKISKALWRAWNPETDRDPNKVWPSVEAYYEMRGAFLDRTRRFEVVVRSRLDYTKESFLSCL